MTVPPITIAIDGPVASGKTTVGRIVADDLGARFLDTGWMYRAVAAIVIMRALDVISEATVTAATEAARMELRGGDGGERLLIDGEDITARLRDREVERLVSTVAAMSGVRRALVRRQRDIAAQGPIVMVGRDIGTVVLADAPLKDAGGKERARRRHEEVTARGGDTPLEDIVNDLVRRDKIDSERADSPLRPAEDAVCISTDNLGPDKVARQIVDLWRTRAHG